MNNGFEIIIEDKSYTSDEFRTLCKYNNVELSIYSDGMLDSLVSMWNTVMPVSKTAKLMFDKEPSVGFKRKVSFSNKVYNPIPDPRNSKGKY